MVVERDYFKNRDVVTGSVEGCEWVSFLVLTVEFANQTRGVNVEEVDDDLSVLTPVRSKDNCLVFDLEYTVIDDDDLDVAHMMGGLIKTLLSKIQKLFYAQFKWSPFTTISTTFFAISS